MISSFLKVTERSANPQPKSRGNKGGKGVTEQKPRQVEPRARKKWEGGDGNKAGERLCSNGRKKREEADEVICCFMTTDL